jgi:hypothetical protein
MSSYVRNHECKRSINTPEYEKNKLLMKRKNRRDYYERKKLDVEWLTKEKERNKLRMRENRKNIKLAKENASTTERVCAGGNINNSQ